MSNQAPANAYMRNYNKVSKDIEAVSDDDKLKFARKRAIEIIAEAARLGEIISDVWDDD